MAGETSDPVHDPVSGLPSVTVGHPVTNDDVADALDDDQNIAPTVAEDVNADESTQAAVEASRRTLDGLDDEWGPDDSVASEMVVARAAATPARANRPRLA
jgi:hypothetical protein